jgi:hypothetical protein
MTAGLVGGHQVRHARRSWEGDDLVPGGAPESASGAHMETGGWSAEPPTDYTLRQAVGTLDFWLLFVVFSIGAGCGLQLINNLGVSRQRGILRTI